VLNGDVYQFLHNTGYSIEFTADLIDACRTSGAIEHPQVMSEISAFIEKERAERNAIENDNCVRSRSSSRRSNSQARSSTLGTVDPGPPRGAGGRLERPNPSLRPLYRRLEEPQVCAGWAV